MLSVKKILFPVDFSDRCEVAVPYIVDLVNRFRAKLEFLHVVRDGKHPDTLSAKYSAELAAFAARIPGGIHCPQTVAYGSPAETIVRYADARSIDIIAMPTRKHEVLRRWALGSVTEGVLQKASCAVWMESATGHPHMRWSPVLCAVDLERGSEQVLSYASALADQFHANLKVVHAVPVIGDGSLWHPSHQPPALSESEAKRKLKMLVQNLNISAEVLAEAGGVRSTVGRIAEVVGAKLLVVGRGNDRRAEGSVGAHVYELVRKSPCPVMSCPRGPEPKVCFWTGWQQEGSECEPDSLLISSRPDEEPDLYPVTGILRFSNPSMPTEAPARACRLSQSLPSG